MFDLSLILVSTVLEGEVADLRAKIESTRNATVCADEERSSILGHLKLGEEERQCLISEAKVLSEQLARSQADALGVTVFSFSV